MAKTQTPEVLQELWLDWHFDKEKSPFDGAATNASVKEKQKSIENYARKELLKTRPSWTIEFAWSKSDTIASGFNVKATIFKKKLETTGITFHMRGIGTPQPPPQPPPPNL